jgi:hypothetical protein
MKAVLASYFQLKEEVFRIEWFCTAAKPNGTHPWPEKRFAVIKQSRSRMQ